MSTNLLLIIIMQVNFLTKLVALKPGRTVEEMIKNVMLGKEEGAEDTSSEEANNTSRNASNGIAGKVCLNLFVFSL